jgi:hypothetical protein
MDENREVEVSRNTLDFASCGRYQNRVEMPAGQLRRHPVRRGRGPADQTGARRARDGYGQPWNVPFRDTPRDRFRSTLGAHLQNVKAR